jgi:serine/threonine protein phosphatase PrpC
MGNAVAYDSQGLVGDNQSNHDPGLRSMPDESNLMLQRKLSSFLEEPIISKRTERGEVNVTLRDLKRGREGYDSNYEACADDNNMLRYAVSEMQGWRSHMEDKHALNPTLSSNRHQAQLLKDHHLFAVFDGHGGEFASHYCGEHFVSTLIAQKEWQAYLSLSLESSKNGKTAPDSTKALKHIKRALTLTFLELDRRLHVEQKKIRQSQLYRLKSLVSSIGGSTDLDIFQVGTRDHDMIMRFDRQLPPSVPAGVKLERSGSTGVVVLVTPTHIICANAGDSRAILSKKNNLLPLSFDHKPGNDVELTRVEKDGGFVRAGRVDGDLAVSRSFGDFGYKNSSNMINSSSSTTSSSTTTSTGTTPRDYRVTVYPDIIVHKREPNKDEFVVLACDGIWDRLTNKDCSDLVRSLIYNDSEMDVGLICEEIIDTALELDSRDNMTCCVVLFPGANVCPPHGCDLSSVSTTSSGVMKRRLDREKSWGKDSTPAKRALKRLEERRMKHYENLALRKTSSSEHYSSKNQLVRGRSSDSSASSRRKHKASSVAPAATGLRSSRAPSGILLQ